MRDLGASARLALDKKRCLGLDILRIAATWLVLLSHFGVFAAVHYHIPKADLFFIPGPLGLASFFVLSGFLIGNMLFDIIERGPSFCEWKIFATRRLLRVMPAYVLWLVVLSLASSTTPSSLSRFLHYLTLTQSFAWPMPSDNWFGVSWSLAIEVWFYLLFGAFSLIAAAIWGYRGLLTALAAFLLLPLIARACIPPALPWDEWVRKITLLRLDAIATGVAVALVVRQYEWVNRHHLTLAFFGVACLLSIILWWVLAVGRFELQTRVARTLVFNGLQMGVGLIMPTLLHLPYGSSSFRRIFAWLSDATYAIYLVHLSFLIWALFLIDRGFFSFGFGMALAFAATIAWAALSLHFIERPIRRYRLGLHVDGV